MRKYLSFLLVFSLIFSMTIIPNFAAVPLDTGLAMYATGSEVGADTGLSIIIARNNPANAYGEFNAIQNAGENLFYSLASHEYTKFTFDNPFYNIEDTPTVTDMQFSEVTWGESWHPEAALVFLVDTKTGTIDTPVNYAGNDGGFGYFAGIIWNKVGLQIPSQASRDLVLSNYATLFGVGSRVFLPNLYHVDGNFGVTQFKMPEEVVSASSVVLVDITDEIYTLAGPTRASTYGTGPNYASGKDGYDLDAIRVYGYDPIVISGTVDGQKYDGSGTFLDDVAFDFEIYTWTNDQKGDLIAKAQSDIANFGDFLFSQPGDIDNISASNLVLPEGNYYIEEVNIPIAYKFVKFIIVDDGVPSSDLPNGALFTINGEEQTISIESYNEKALSHFEAYKFDGSSEEPIGFVDYSFDFVLKDIDNMADYALGYSLMDGTGLIVWDLVGTEEVEMLSSLELPVGNFKVVELPKVGFSLDGTKLILQDVDDLEPTILPGTSMEVPFYSLGDRSIRVEFANSLIYKNETAYAYFNDDSIRLNTLRKNNNWGWYIDTDNLLLDTPYPIYAGAGSNDITKGMYMGTVTFTKPGIFYDYDIHLIDYPGKADPIVVEEHLGVYKTSGEIPLAPGKFTNLVPADQSGVLVLHLVISYPSVMPD